MALTATNLLNYVSGGNRSTIDGVLNGIKNGQIGGNVYLLNPQGFMVSNSGVINVGSLTLATPAQSFVDQAFNSAYNPSLSAANAILNNSVPINASGLISIQGKVNAIKPP